jgi:SAM-dependent methyltransferase
MIRSIARTLIPLRYRRAARALYPYIRYAGLTVHCPCCGGWFRCFLPGGRDNRPNAECPGCGCLERHRLLWHYLVNRTSLGWAPATVLQLAPERVIRRRLMALPNLVYVTGDLDSPLARVTLDILSLPFPDNSFDVILCNHVLEHIPDDAQAMRELSRILKPDGWAILQVPLDPTRDTFEDPSIVDPRERTRLFGQEDHVRMYGRDYKTRLERAGLNVTADAYASEFGDDEVRRYGIVPSEDIYRCSKRRTADLPDNHAGQIDSAARLRLSL